MNDKLYFWHADKYRNLLQVDTIILVVLPDIPRVPKNKFAYLATSSKKHGGGEVEFLSADKHKNFLQVDNITLGVHIQACIKYPKQQVYNIFVISQRKHGGLS